MGATIHVVLYGSLDAMTNAWRYVRFVDAWVLYAILSQHNSHKYLYNWKLGQKCIMNHLICLNVPNE